MKVPIRSHLIFTAGFVTTTIAGFSVYHHNQLYNAPGDRLKSMLDFRQYQFQRLPQKASDNFFENVKTMIKTRYENTSEHKRVVYGLIAVNTVVFLGWQIPQLSRFMTRHFVHLPIRSSPHTLLTCVFSHQNLMHFGFNMMALSSFYPYFAMAGNFSTPEALSFYLSAGVLSSFASHLLSSTIPARALAGGLGASGAIYGLVAGCCYFNPTGKIGIMFVPYSFEMQEFLPFLIGFDILGLILRWQTLDHAAHLAGAAVGYLWARDGKYFWRKIQNELYTLRFNYESKR